MEGSDDCLFTILGPVLLWCTDMIYPAIISRQPFDCNSLPHMKQRRRAQLSSQLTAARSEASLRQRPLSVFEPPGARSAAHVAETPGEPAGRLEFEEIPLDDPSQQEATGPPEPETQQPRTPKKMSMKVTERRYVKHCDHL